MFKFILVILVALVAFCFTMAAITYNQGQDDKRSYSQHCTDKGGHIYSADGSIAFCVSPDGRFVEVHP